MGRILGSELLQGTWHSVWEEGRVKVRIDKIQVIGAGKRKSINIWRQSCRDFLGELQCFFVSSTLEDKYENVHRANPAIHQPLLPTDVYQHLMCARCCAKAYGTIVSKRFAPPWGAHSLGVWQSPMCWVLLSGLSIGSEEIILNVAPAGSQMVREGRFPGRSRLLNQDLTIGKTW